MGDPAAAGAEPSACCWTWPRRDGVRGGVLFFGMSDPVVIQMMMMMMWKTIEREPTRSWRTTQEFVVVWGEFGSLRVSRSVGAWIADVTTRRWRPRWIEFVDNVGSLIRLQTRQVRGIHDSTPRQRARFRAASRALEQEDEA